MSEREQVVTLKPCPFTALGGKHSLETKKYVNRWSPFQWIVTCWCGATGPSRSTEADAINAWNSRASAAAPQGDAVYPRRLTLPELNHLSALLEAERESGSYAGPREQYYARTERLIKWCGDQIGGK